MTNTLLRKASLEDLAALLTQQQSRKVDVVAHAAHLRSEEGRLVISGTDAVISADGVDLADGTYAPTDVFIRGVASKLGIPAQYLRRLHDFRPDLYDANVNGWLQGGGGWPADSRQFTVRAFADEDGGVGVARAFLSDKYAFIENLDTLTATLDGVRDSGAGIDVSDCDLTDNRMYVKIRSADVAALAPTLLKGYVSPFTGARGDDNPTVFAGFVLSNSETGGGAWSIKPQITVEVCNNGMTITKDMVRAVHLGGKHDAGVIQWSQDTNRKSLDLIRARTRDAVTTFLDKGYLDKTVAELEAKAGKPMQGDVPAAVQRIGDQLSFTKEETAGVLDHFIRGGQMTAGGVLQAVTSFAQTIEDADHAADMEASGLRALALA